MFVSVLVKKQLSTALCKIHDFEYVTCSRMAMSWPDYQKQPLKGALNNKCSWNSKTKVWLKSLKNMWRRSFLVKLQTCRLIACNCTNKLFQLLFYLSSPMPSLAPMYWLKPIPHQGSTFDRNTSLRTIKELNPETASSKTNPRIKYSTLGNNYERRGLYLTILSKIILFRS